MKALLGDHRLGYLQGSFLSTFENLPIFKITLLFCP